MKALLIIDIQNDYFQNGKYPLWNTEATLSNTENAINAAQSKNIPIIHIQHIANTEKGPSPFFNSDTEGVAIHPRILAADPGAQIIVKQYADSFLHTDLEKTLEELEIKELLICGMMTQNCVTHTAISKTAEKYTVTILEDCCTTVDEMIHKIALNAISSRVPIKPWESAI